MRRTGSWLTLAALLASTSALAAEVTERVDAQRMGAEDELRWTVSVTGAGSSPELELVDDGDFEVAGRTVNENVRVQHSAGGTQIARSWDTIFRLRARRTGDLRLPTAEVTADGRSTRTQGGSVEVVPGALLGGAAPPDPFEVDPFSMLDDFPDDFEALRQQMRELMRGGRGWSFEGPAESVEPRLVVEAAPRQPIPGQQVTYSVYLLADANVRSVSGLQLPKVDGASSEELEVPNPPRGELVEDGGRTYQRFLLARRALFPRSEGRLILGPASATIETGTAFADTTQVIRSAKTSIQVRATPAEAVDAAVGNWELELRTPKELKAGEPAQLTLVARGTGDVRGLELPPLKIQNARVFEPTLDVKVQPRGTRVGGTRAAEYVVVPDGSGPVEIAAASLKFYDPSDRRAEVARTEQRSLPVVGASTLTATAPPPPEANEQAPLLDPQRRRDLAWTAGLALGLAALVAAVVWATRRTWRSRLGKRARAAVQTRRASRRAEALQRRGHPRVGAERLEQAYRQWAEAQAGVPPGGMAHESLLQTLRSRGVPQERAAAAVEVMHFCEAARYSARPSDELRRALDASQRFRDARTAGRP